MHSACSRSDTTYTPFCTPACDVQTSYGYRFDIERFRLFGKVWGKRKRIVVHTPLQRNVETVEIGTIAIFFSRIAMLSRVSQVSRVGFSLARASSTARVWVDKNTRVIGQGITGKNVG